MGFSVCRSKGGGFHLAMARSRATCAAQAIHTFFPPFRSRRVQEGGRSKTTEPGLEAQFNSLRSRPPRGRRWPPEQCRWGAAGAAALRWMQRLSRCLMRRRSESPVPMAQPVSTSSGSPILKHATTTLASSEYRSLSASVLYAGIGQQMLRSNWVTGRHSAFSSVWGHPGRHGECNAQLNRNVLAF